MRYVLVLALVGCNGLSGSGGSSGSRITLPKIYPPVRAATPDGLIADPMYTSLSLGHRNQALGGTGPTLADAVQSRLYSMGPTEILRLMSDLDDRTQMLDTRTDAHPCLTSAPVTKTYSLPGGETFLVKLQCMQQATSPGGDPGSQMAIAFGFDQALAAAPDGGSPDASSHGGVGSTDGGGDYFYLVESQPRGLGSLYRIDRASENVEGWIAVADQGNLTQSQVVMHLMTNKAEGTLEIALGGSNVGFCSAHLKTSPAFLFIHGETNGSVMVGGSLPPSLSCDPDQTGCFATSALGTNLGDSASCAPLASSFAIGGELDASSGGNVDYRMIYSLLNQAPTGIPMF